MREWGKQVDLKSAIMLDWRWLHGVKIDEAGPKGQSDTSCGLYRCACVCLCMYGVLYEEMETNVGRQE